MSTIRMMRTYIVVLVVGLLLSTVSAQAYHFPWDQGHDTTNWTNPPDPGTCKESTCDPCKSTGSPVYIPNGQFVWSDTDVALKGRPDLRVRRTYNSQDARDGLFGNGWSVSFDIALYQAVQGGVTSEYILRTANGKRYIFLKQADGSILTPAGRFEKVIPQADGTAQLLFQDGSTMNFRRDGKLVSDSDSNGNTISYSYNNDDQLSGMNDGNGRSFTFTYNSCGRISHVTDHANRDWSYSYDANGNLVSITDPMNGVRRYAYTPYKASGDGYTYQYLTTVTDPTNVVVVQVVYSAGKVQSYTEGQNRYTYSYNTTSRQTTKTDLMGSRWIYTYNTQGTITNLIDPLNNQISFTYDANGLHTQMTDQLGKPWKSTYDILGRMLTSSNPLNESIAWEYNGSITRPTKLTTPGGKVYTFVYDSKGNITSVTDPAGAQGMYTWNAKGDLVTITDVLGNKETIVYNAIGLPVSITDALNRVVAYTYDALGNMVQMTNAADEKGTMDFDALGQVVNVSSPLGHVTSFSYDRAGRLTSITDANGGTIGYKYDAYGRLIEKTASDGRKHTYAYRTDNLLGSTTDPKNQTTTYSYDASKRLTQENAAGQITSYTYTARNQLVSATNTSSSVSAVYNDAGRLTQETNGGKNIQYAYNSDGQRINFTTLGSTTSYAYDNRGLLTGIASPSGFYSFTRDLMGRTISLTHPNNDVISYQYNVASQLTGISSAGIVNTTYGYERDAAGRITRWTGDGSDWFYQYDATGRLVRADHGQDNFAYTYDPLGNILENSRTYDIANRLLNDNAYTYSYDLNGNLTKKQNKVSGARKEYFWNARNQLVKVDRYADAGATVPSTTTSYSYDPLGRRINKIVDGVQERFVYDGWNLIAVTDASGTPREINTFGPGVDRPLGTLANSTNSYYYPNHQGSIMATAGYSAKIGDFSYAPYGSSSDGEKPDRFGYTAREYEEDDLYFYRARYYDPTVQRFISEDPIGVKGGLNLYRYANNDPVTFTDPSGEIAPAILAIWGIVEIGLAIYDAYDTASVLLDPCAGGWEKGISGGLFILGAIAPGGGYSQIDNAGKAAGKTVLGHFPDYINMADNVGAHKFDIPVKVWDKMSDAERWIANQKFLDRAIKRGDDILLATPIEKVKPGSYFERELKYLFDQGYKLSQDGLSLIK